MADKLSFEQFLICKTPSRVVNTTMLSLRRGTAGKYTAHFPAVPLRRESIVVLTTLDGVLQMRNCSKESLSAIPCSSAQYPYPIALAWQYKDPTVCSGKDPANKGPP